ncbi:MAG: LacI family DNA-binding transcriptional regulator [bacterium]
MLRRPAKTNSRITLKEIAHLAEVSVSAASFVLSGQAEERRISAEVAARVRRVAEEQGYIPNLLVRSILNGRTNVISFYNAFTYRTANDIYMDRIRAAVELSAGAHGYDVLIHCDQRRTAHEIFQMLGGGFCDGLLFFGTPDNSELLDLLRGARLPTVLLNHTDAQGILPFVSDDYRGGLRQVAKALVQCGHRRIAAFVGNPSFDGPMRVAALKESLREYGVELRDSQIIEVYEQHRSPDDGLRFLMDSPEPPTALFCWHDRLGYETLEACERLGIDVPRHLSLVGYDGLHWPSTSPHILTSVRIPLESAAEMAVALLNDLVEGRHTGETGLSYPVTLLKGATLASSPG